MGSDQELIAELDRQLEYEDLHAPLEAAIMALRNRLANPPKPVASLTEGGGEAGEDAERDVGRYLYNRLEALVYAGAKSPELDWIALVIESVEEYGASHCGSDELAPFPAALPSPIPDGWRDDMENAPRDQTLLGVVEGDVRLIRWGKTSHVPMFGWNLADQGVEDFDLCDPTHWLPLPAAPKS